MTEQKRDLLWKTLIKRGYPVHEAETIEEYLHSLKCLFIRKQRTKTKLSL